MVQAIRAHLTFADKNGNQVAYTAATCERSNAGEPPPKMNNHLFVAVWHDGSRESKSREAKHEVFGIRVTVTVRVGQPYDRMVVHRDKLEVLLNPIAALIHWGIAPGPTPLANIMLNACTLANLDPGGANSNAALRVGFREALWFQRYDSVQEVGPDWFQAHIDSPGPPTGLKQTAYFGGANRVQAIGSLMS